MNKSQVLEIIDTNKRFIEDKIQQSSYGRCLPLGRASLMLSAHDVIASQIPIISTSTVDWLVIKPAKYGRGVFATKPLKKGEYACFYPCHQIARRNSENDKEWDVISPEGHPTAYKDYCLTLSPTLKIASIPSEENLLFCGHIINDPCKDVEIKHLRQWISRYDNLKPNTEFDIIDDVWVGIKVIRDIQPEEELTVCYGVKYWLHRNNIFTSK